MAVQRAFVLASRQAAVRAQRLRVGIAIGVALVASGLSVWAVYERQVAERRYREALSRQLTIESNTVRNARLFMTGGDPIMVETEGNLGQPRATGQSEPWQRLVDIRSGGDVAIEQQRLSPFGPVFSRDSGYLAAGPVIWSVGSGRVVARLDGHIIAFSPDQRLALTRADQVIRAWPWRDEDLLALACSQLGANLTAEEWRRHVSRDEPPAKTCVGLP